jgi:hypothetical protein
MIKQMGTNYYLNIDPCPTCGRAKEELHIGKSSGGWCFALHVYPNLEINNLADWQRRWSKENTQIRNEYGDITTKDEMLDIITQRSRTPRVLEHKEFYQLNHAEAGPNNLLRAQIDGIHCIGHGKGTWDLFVGEFS